MIWFPALLALIVLVCITFTAKTAQPQLVGSGRTTHDDRPYMWEYKTTGKHNRPLSSRIAVPANPGFAFAIERERFMHRLAKLFGFCQEFQTQRPDFDQRAYIQSDDKTLQMRVAGNATLQHQISDLFQSGVRSVFAMPKYLVAELAKAQPEVPPEGDKIATALYAMRNHFESSAVSQPSAFEQPLGRTILKALPAIFITTTLLAFTLSIIMNYQLLDWDLLWDLEWQISGAIILIVLASIRILYGNSSYGYPLLMHFLRYGSWSAATACASFLWFANCMYDTQPAEIHEQIVTGKHISRGKSRTYYLYTGDWHNATGDLSLRVSSGLYNQTSVGNLIRIHAHRGALGIEWVGAIERLNP